MECFRLNLVPVLTLADPMVTTESTIPSTMEEMKLVGSELDGGGQMDIGLGWYLENQTPLSRLEVCFETK